MSANLIWQHCNITTLKLSQHFQGLKIQWEWESKGFSNKMLKCAYVANVSVSPKLILIKNTRIRLRFKASCRRQDDKAPFTPNNVINLFIVCELDRQSQDLNNGFNLKDCLLRA